MGYSITGNAITLTRGDTLIVKIGMTKNGDPYTPVEGERVRFAMKQKYKDPDDQVILVKEIPISTMILELEPEDTKSLKMGAEFVYDIEYTDIEGHVDTFIKGTLYIDNEVI